jgi:hypothetical protein
MGREVVMVVASAIAALMVIAIVQSALDIRHDEHPTLAAFTIGLACIVLLGVAWWFLFATGVLAGSN